MAGLRGKPRTPTWAVFYHPPGQVCGFWSSAPHCCSACSPWIPHFSVLSCPTTPHLPPREYPLVPVTEPTASPRSPAIGDIVSQVIQLELWGETEREAETEESGTRHEVDQVDRQEQGSGGALRASPSTSAAGAGEDRRLRRVGGTSGLGRGLGQGQRLWGQAWDRVRGWDQVWG